METIIDTCRCSIKVIGQLYINRLHHPSPMHPSMPIALLWGQSGSSHHLWSQMQCYLSQIVWGVWLPALEAQEQNFPAVRGLTTICCQDDWIAEGTYISVTSRPEHHSSVKDSWWVKSPGSCQRVINGDRYTTWETGWEGKKIIYKWIVNSCTYC